MKDEVQSVVGVGIEAALTLWYFDHYSSLPDA